MKVKAKDIYLCTESINTLGSKDLEINTAIKVLKNLREIKEVYDIIDTKRAAIATKYNVTDTSNTKGVAEGTKAFNAILSEDVNINISMIKYTELAGIKLSAVQLADISFMLEE